MKRLSFALDLGLDLRTWCATLQRRCGQVQKGRSGQRTVLQELGMLYPFLGSANVKNALPSILKYSALLTKYYSNEEVIKCYRHCSVFHYIFTFSSLETYG